LGSPVTSVPMEASTDRRLFAKSLSSSVFSVFSVAKIIGTPAGSGFPGCRYAHAGCERELRRLAARFAAAGAFVDRHEPALLHVEGLALPYRPFCGRVRRDRRAVSLIVGDEELIVVGRMGAGRLIRKRPAPPAPARSY